MANNTLGDALVMTVQELAPCQKKFDFTVSAEDIKKAAAQAARQFSMLVPVQGFRKGKAPVNMILAKFEKEIREELGRRLVSAAFEKISEDKSLEVVSCTMSEEPAELKFDAEFKFALVADLAPEIAVSNYMGVKVTVPAVKVEESAVDERLDYYRKMYGNYSEVNEPAKAEDMLKVSYTSDFVPPEGASASLVRQVNSEENWLWLNEPEFIPGSIAALTGAEAGKEYTFDSVYPEDYRDAELSGKTVKYTVKVIAIQRRTPLTDAELCEKVNVASIDELRAQLTKAMENEGENKRRTEILEKVYDAINASVPEFTLPPGILETETNKILRQMAQEQVKTAEQAEAFKAKMEENKAEAGKQASEKLRRTFIFRRIAQLENVSVSRQEVDTQIGNMSRYYGYKEKDFRNMLQKSGAMEDLQLDILNSKVWDMLADKAEVSAE